MRNTKEYKAVKNLIHNELGLTKEDFKKILIEAMQDEARSHARKLLSSTDAKDILNTAVTTQVTSMLKSSGYTWERSQITNTIANVLANKLQLTIKQ